MAVTAPVFSMTLVPSGVPLFGVSSIWLIPTAVAVALAFASATVASPPAPTLRPTDTVAALDSASALTLMVPALAISSRPPPASMPMTVVSLVVFDLETRRQPRRRAPRLC